MLRLRRSEVDLRPALRRAGPGLCGARLCRAVRRALFAVRAGLLELRSGMFELCAGLLELCSADVPVRSADLLPHLLSHNTGDLLPAGQQ